MNNTYLFFDTETTGLPKNYKVHYSEKDNYPFLVQLAWILYQNEKEISFSDFIIIPNGFEIPESAINIHGFSNEYCNENGYDLKKILNKFYTDFKLCDMLVAHNLEFDKNIICSELYRNNAAKHAEEIYKSKGLCTMKESIDFCKIPGKYGNKFPKLSELHTQLFSENFDNAHNALNDIRATAKCFFEMKKRNIIKVN